jgi:hypothetical protein
MNRMDYRPGRTARVTEDTAWKDTLVEILDFPHEEVGVLKESNPWVKVRLLEIPDAYVDGKVGQKTLWTMEGLKLEPYESGICAACDKMIYGVIDYLCKECRA